ncbi:MAG TPA: hypothetical protein VK210_16195, partial [Terriglobia bacterium]|nr:hypothetical protein [Terriglobia bacterium]
RSGEDLRRLEISGAAEPLRHGCDLGHVISCGNLNTLTGGNGKFASVSPMLEDYPVILRGSKGPIRDLNPTSLMALACREGWPNTCVQKAAAFQK